MDITGTATGAVLVRNPNFSMAFSHPRTIRTGEPYEASVTLLNTSLVDANLVSVTLPSASVSSRIAASVPRHVHDAAPSLATVDRPAATPGT